MYEEYANHRANELRAAETQILHRIEWERLSRFERLERALKAARAKLTFPVGTSLKTNN